MVVFDHADVGHRGRYSVQRALALHEYCERTSPFRVFVVCFLAPASALLGTVALDSIPLVDPSRGWKANYAFWIRTFWQLFFVSIGGALQMKPMLTPGTIATMGAVVIASASSASFVAFQLLLASSWGFPIPFSIVSTVGVYISLFCFFTTLVIGPRRLAASQTLQQQLKAHVSIGAAEGLLVLIYPTFDVLFTRVLGLQQKMLVCTLPVINFMIRFILARVSADLDECMATINVCSVEVFNALYMSICMQVATSPLTIPLIFAARIAPIGFAVRTIYLQTNVDIQPYESEVFSKNRPGELPQRLRAVFYDSRVRGSRMEMIRIDATIPLSVSKESRELLEELHSIRNSPRRSTRLRLVTRESTAKPLGPTEVKYSEERKTDVYQTSSIDYSLGNSLKQACSSTVYAFNDAVPHRSAGVSRSSESKSSLTRDKTCRTNIKTPQKLSEQEAVREKLQALFHCEYLTLSEYVECVVPLLYATYLGILHCLPNRGYYEHSRALTPSKMSSTLDTLAMYGSIEIISLALLHVLLKRRL